MKLFTELKRRGVMQVAIAYVVASWLLVQVADTVLPAFEAPVWSMRALIVLLAIGFPITLLISWLFDITSKGLVRTSDLESGPTGGVHRSGLLNHIIIGILAAAVVMFALDKFVLEDGLVPVGDSDFTSIAVLPFQNMSTEEDNDAFTVGIHDDLLTQLSKISAFHTLSRTSVLHYAGSPLPIPDIADELGAAVVLEGGVQRSADRVRINAQLVDGNKNINLWAETYDRQLTAENIFAIQSEISRAIASALRATLTEDEVERLEQVPTDSLEAYDAYTKGLAALDSGGVEDFDRAVAQFSLAIDIDPEFASAWAGKCQAHLSQYQKSRDVEKFELAEAACKQALVLDDSRVEVHIALGTLYRYFGQYARAEVALQRANYAKAEQSLEQALSLDALTIDAMVELGNVLARQDRLEEAEAGLLKAEALNPRHYGAQSALFSLYYVYSDRPDRFEQAAKYGARMASLRPDLPSSWNNLGTAQFMLNRYDDAATAWNESLALDPTRTAYTNTGLAFYYAGRFAESAEMQRRATGIAPRDHRAWGRLGDALRHQGGEDELAIETYRHAAELALESLEVNDQDWQTLGQLAVYHIYSDEILLAEQAINSALEISNRRAEVLYYAALMQLVQGHSEASLDLLEETIERDQGYQHLIASDPDFSGSLSEMPRFQALINAT